MTRASVASGGGRREKVTVVDARDSVKAGGRIVYVPVGSSTGREAL